ncbi:hypothetical protein Tco_0128603 [Tanacetum coccineum]
MTYGNGFELLSGMSFKEDRVVWMLVDGGKVRTRLVSNVVAKIMLLLLRVEELALEAMEYDDQDEEDDLHVLKGEDDEQRSLNL